MPTFTSDAYLQFFATDNGTALTPTTNFDHNSSAFDVFDNGDGNADAATDYFSSTFVPYSGYTIEINGQDYAIFTSGFGDYNIPYFDPTEAFGTLAGTAVTQPITKSGENAVVVNLCFAAGTLIATPQGERAVETLAIGDMIRTADGRDVAVKAARRTSRWPSTWRCPSAPNPSASAPEPWATACRTAT